MNANKLKSFKINYRQARNSVVFANGGANPHLRTQLGLYRLSGSGFTKSLESGGFVQLGEELMLRAQIKYGDGKCTIKQIPLFNEQRKPTKYNRLITFNTK